jgi:hypothetical protein
MLETAAAGAGLVLDIDDNLFARQVRRAGLICRLRAAAGLADALACFSAAASAAASVCSTSSGAS